MALFLALAGTSYAAAKLPARRTDNEEWTQQSVTTTYRLQAGDSVTEVVQQKSGGILAVNNERTNFSMVWVGP